MAFVLISLWLITVITGGVFLLTYSWPTKISQKEKKPLLWIAITGLLASLSIFFIIKLAIPENSTTLNILTDSPNITKTIGYIIVASGIIFGLLTIKQTKHLYFRAAAITLIVIGITTIKLPKWIEQANKANETQNQPQNEK